MRRYVGVRAGRPARSERKLETARTHGRAEDERWHIRKDGSRFFASGVLTQVCDGEGRLLGFAKVMDKMVREIVGMMEQPWGPEYVKPRPDVEPDIPELDPPPARSPRMGLPQ